jgi:polysaccharide biosynthesis protein PslG
MRKLVVAIALVIHLGAAAGAAAAPRHFYGLVTAQDPTSSEFTRIGNGRVGTLRLNLSWPSVQPSGPGTPYDWTRYDTLIGLAAQNGIRVLPTIYGSPIWAAAKTNYPPDAPYMDDFEAFMRAAAQRYGPGGTFWTLNPLIPALPIFEWQMWNEVNSPSYWLPKPHPRQYKPLLQAAKRAIKGVNPRAHILLAGLFLTPRIKHGVTLVRYLSRLYRLKTKGLFDAVAVHPYARTPRDAIASVELVRALMRKFKDRKTPIWLTEVGWSTGGARTPLTVSRKRQASYLRKIFRLAASKRRRLRIAGVAWYSFTDLPGRTWFNHTGLFTDSGAAKPAWKAFVRLTGGTP